MKIGIVDLDTSHPQHWISIERDLGHEVTGVWDGGSVHPPVYVAQFAAEHDVARIYSSLEEMADDVDCGIIHGCDWDTHIDKAQPFVEAGKSVLLDKPLAGNWRDLEQIRQWQTEGVRIAGGSSLLFAETVQDFLKRPPTERGVPHTVVCGCGVDEFNYGIHGYALAIAILGGGVATVRCLGEEPQKRVWARWHDGRTALIVVGASEVWLPFYATIVTERSVTHVEVDTGTLYRQLLMHVLPYLSGESVQPPIDPDVWLQPELCALAAKASEERGGSEIALGDLATLNDSYDGHAFAATYRLSKYPNAAVHDFAKREGAKP